MMNLLIKKNERTKLDIFTRIMTEKGIESHTLTTQLLLSKVSFYRLISQLNDDFITYQLPVKIIYENGKYFSEKKEPHLHASNLIHELLQNYLQASPMFQLTYLFLHQKQAAITDVTEQLMISQSHAYYVIRQSIPFFNHFNLELVTENKEVFLKGRSSDLFLFRSLVYSFLFFQPPSGSTIECEWNISLNNKLVQSYSKNLTNFELINLNTLFYVFEYTDIDQHELSQEICSSAISLFISIFKEANTVIDHPFLLFFLPIFVPRIYTHHTMIQFGRHLASLEQSNLINLSKQLLDHTISTFQVEEMGPPSDEYYICLYILALHLSYIYFFKKDIKHAFYAHTLTTTKISKEADLYKKITAFYEAFTPADIAWTTKEQAQEVLIDTLYLFVLSQQKKQKIIYIDFGGNIIAEWALKRNLLALFNKEAFDFSLTEETADIIISNNVFPTDKSTASFILVEDFNDPDFLKDIYTRLIQLL